MKKNNNASFEKILFSVRTQLQTALGSVGYTYDNVNRLTQLQNSWPVDRGQIVVKKIGEI